MEKNMIAISGNTYPVKDQIKALGGKWEPDRKCWMVPEAKAEQARQIVAGAPASSSRTTNSYRPHKCIVCGAVERRNSRGYFEVKIYRSGECGDCYEERKMGY